MTLAEHDPRPDPMLEPGIPGALRPWDDQGIGTVYTERAHLTAVLAALFPSVMVFGADPHAPDWPVLYVDLPTGQASWHVSPADLPIFKWVDSVTSPAGPAWDGHTNDEKYDRIARLTQQVAVDRAVEAASTEQALADTSGSE
jgi:hypothetical protein